jgi:hypothetical protein
MTCANTSPLRLQTVPPRPVGTSPTSMPGACAVRRSATTRPCASLNAIEPCEAERATANPFATPRTIAMRPSRYASR